MAAVVVASYPKPAKSLVAPSINCSRRCGALSRGMGGKFVFDNEVLQEATHESEHDDPQPDERTAADQDTEARQDAHRLAEQLLHHPHADVPRAEDEKEARLRPAVFL